MLRKLMNVKYVNSVHKLQHRCKCSQVTFVKGYNIARLDVDV